MGLRSRRGSRPREGFAGELDREPHRGELRRIRVRLLHTSDWHLGRMLANERLIEDQSYVLRQLLDAARGFRPDVVLVSGDIYDRAVPPPEAISLLDEVLSDLVLGCQIPVVLIPGNHDSRERLSFASRLLERGRLHLVNPHEPFKVVPFNDEAGLIEVLAVPYLEPAEARELLQRADLADHDAALRALLAETRRTLRAPRRILVAHAFVAGGERSDSERPLAVGGAGEVGADCFSGFHYVALGHLHRAQCVGDEALQYSGSILKYSFQEAAHQKFVNLVELDGRGALRIERLPLRPRREVRCLTGRFDDLMAATPPEINSTDLLHITLLDERPVLDAALRLRERYPNLLGLEQPSLAAAAQEGIRPPSAGLSTDEELFADFFQQVTGEQLSDEELAELRAALEESRRKELDL